MAGSGLNGPKGGRAKMIQGINVTPLVDITLVLLIIFMVTARFTSTQAIPLDLPQAGESEELQTIFAVSVPRDGSIQVDGDDVEVDALDELAAKQLERDADLRAVIRADGDVSHSRVMAVMDALRAGGLTRVAFATKSREPSQPPVGANSQSDHRGGERGEAN